MLEQSGDNAVTVTGTTNTSGQGSSSVLPQELQGWNWGGFLLTWIWGVGNQVWLALLALIPVPFAALAVAVVLGLKGNEWAWQSKKWDSIAQFQRTQRIWMIWGIVALFLPLLFIVGVLLIMVGVLGYYGYVNF